jgi:hypothetical protein
MYQKDASFILSGTVSETDYVPRSVRLISLIVLVGGALLALGMRMAMGMDWMCCMGGC